MPAKKVWGDFVRLEDRHGPAKQQYSGPWTIDVFARWRCPYCSDVIEARAADAIDKKADVCKDHFWGKNPCAQRPLEDVRGKSKASTSTASVEAILREQLEQTKQQMKQASEQHTASMEQASKQHAEAMAIQTAQLDALRQNERQLMSIRDVQRMAVCTALELSEHSSDDDDGAKITIRAKRKLAAVQTAATMDVLGKVAKAGAFSPPRDDEEDMVVVGKRIVDCVSVAAVDASKVQGLQCQLADINNELGLPKRAPPAERVNAIRNLHSEIVETRKQAERHFDNVTHAAGCVHGSPSDQLEHIERLSKTAAAASVFRSTPNARNNEHLSRIDGILGIEKYKVVTCDVREAIVKRLTESTKAVKLTPKINKKLRIALSDDHLRDASDLASAKAARDRLGM